MRRLHFISLLALILPVSDLISGVLTVTQDGPGVQRLYVNGVYYPFPFSQSYAAGTSVTLEARPSDRKYQFLYWDGYIDGTDNPVTFTMPWLGNVSIAASFSLSPPDIDTSIFPPLLNVGVAVPGSTCYNDVVITNIGGQTLYVVSMSITGADASQFFVANVTQAFSLAVDATHTLTVGFTAAGLGNKYATLNIFSNDPDENPFQIQLEGTGVVPDIASDPASWDYGAVNAGSFMDKTFVISNTGTANLSVTVVTLSGADASDFSIQSGGGPFTLAPGATQNVVVRFNPAGSGVKSASLSFTSNDPDENPFLVPLSGGIFIVVDGIKDSFYSTLTGPENGYIHIPSPLYNNNGAPRDDQDLSAKMWMAWDDTYLYVYEEVVDDTVHANNVTDWANDCMELKIDPDPSKKATDGVLTFNLTALDSADTQPAFYSGIANPADPSDYARRKTADGYVLELRVKWTDMTISGRGPVVPAAGNVFGLAINQHDNDQYGRQASVQWSAKLADEVWFNPRLLGKVTFLADHKLLLEARNAIVDTLVNPLAPLYVPNALPWPMLTMDVGSVRAAGSASYNTGVYTISGSGVDIWDRTDGFRYAFRQVSGDVELTARITGLTKSDPWTKGGLMIRDGLTANASHAMMAVASDHGLTFQNRERDGALCTYVAGNTTIKPPYWLKILRSGNTFIGLASADGASWVEVGRKVIAMNDPVYVGMAVTAHRDGSLSTGTFSDVSFKFTGVTGVEELAASRVATQGFALSQNYPNPFNAVTRISYDLSRPATVKIVIYDITGCKIKTLVNQMQTAGRYTIEFDASGLGSGFYFCDMEVDHQHMIKKMLLLK